MIEESEYLHALEEQGVSHISKATIRQCVAVSQALEPTLGEKFVHMEFGIPGLPACSYGVEAEIEALRNGVASIYPNAAGEQPVKNAAARFVEAFMDVHVQPEDCIPTVGSMQASYNLFLMLSQYHPQKDTILFIDPGFPAHHTQTKILGIRSEAFDVYEFRGEKLRDKLESYLQTGRIAAIFYSNPNNPSWVCLTEQELKIVGELATKYDTIVIEDLAYMGMDFRKDLSHPYQAPYPATAAHYTDNYILMLSASKIFSYAGQRIAVVVFSPKIYNLDSPLLKERYGITSTLGRNFVFTFLYAASSGTAHAPQLGLAAMMNAAVDGKYDFVGTIREYGYRATRAKEIFLRHGFYVVYDKDGDVPVADGFFFTMGYTDPSTGQPMECEKLLSRLMRCGVCAITLNTTGSLQQGIRCCVSKLTSDADYEALDRRLAEFTRF